jgi:hypothetical protein
MNQSLRPQPLLSEILPGALLLGLLLFDYFRLKPDQFEILSKEGGVLVLAAGAFLLLSWILGTFFDAIRNLFEHIGDRYLGKLNWDFFFKADREKVFQLEEHYFAYYTLNANYVIAIVLFGVAKLILLLSWPSSYYVILCTPVVVALIYLADARSLRKEISKLISEPEIGSNAPPHEGTYTRLRVSSPCRGIGVFAIRDIPEGTNIFTGDTSELIELDPGVIQTVDEELQKLYRDFCVFKNGKMYCPTNFNALTVGWYLNHSKNPNVRCDHNFSFYAARNIKKDEELTADYSTYSDLPPGCESFIVCSSQTEGT